MFFLELEGSCESSLGFFAGVVTFFAEAGEDFSSTGLFAGAEDFLSGVSFFTGVLALFPGVAAANFGEAFTDFSAVVVLAGADFAFFEGVWSVAASGASHLIGSAF